MKLQCKSAPLTAYAQLHSSSPYNADAVRPKFKGVPFYKGSKLHCQLHNGTDNISFGLLESLDSLCSADTSLCHDELNILGLHTTLINITLFLILFD